MGQVIPWLGGQTGPLGIKALISPWRGRGRNTPPCPEESSFDLRIIRAAHPMLPARSGPAPGPQQRRCRDFFKNLDKDIW